MSENSELRNSRKIFLTGGTGFVGSNTAHYLVEIGYNLRCLVRPTSDRSTLPPGVELAEGHLTDKESLRRGVEDCWGAVHIGGAVKAASLQDFYTINREGTALLTQVARESGVERFIYCSSQAAAGPAKGARRIKESDAPVPVTNYGRSKLAGERALAENADGMWWCIVRPPAVYGPKDTSFLSLAKGIKRGFKLRLGQGSKFSIIHAADLSRAFVLALEADQPPGGIYFATDGRNHDDRELSGLIEAILKKKAFMLRIPVSAALAAAAVNSLAGKLTGKTVFITPDKIRDLTQGSYICDDSLLRDATGYKEQYDLETGLKQTIDWYQEKGWL